MKYPQLVSARAVNAISDWLVSRLEQLGVEAPQIYTRLLLSLLQSSVQINDPIEFSNLETFFANRKGNNKRYLPCDTDTLKKLNAIQCLREIVSAEEESASIENLVDELFEKLKDIEKQSGDVEDDSKLLVASLSVVNTNETSSVPNNNSSNALSTQYQQHHHTNLQKHHNSSISNKSSSNNNSNNNSISNIKEQKLSNSDSIETDPKKRYFSAFPALSKEMEDSFRIWRRNANSLTWPIIDRSNISISSNSSSSSTVSNSRGTSSTKASKGNVVEANFNKEILVARSHNIQKEIGAAGSVGAAAAVVKKKTKRRRNQALSKGKPIQNIRKNSSGDIISVSGRHHRNLSPSFWDTDFEGSWEMGRDLIKEFITTQNNRSYRSNRNRSTSESAAYNMKENQKAAEAAGFIEPSERQLQISEHATGGEYNKIISKTLSSPMPLPNVDISFCCDDDDNNDGNDDDLDYDDTLGSISELQTDACMSRRLYQRDQSLMDSNDSFANEKQRKDSDVKQNDDDSNAADDDNEAISDDQLDFQQFKAKFNSNVEALWKDAPSNVATSVDNKKTDLLSYGTSSMSTLPVVAPFKENLKNFWTNYYSHHFDLAKIPSSLADAGAVGTQTNESCTSLSSYSSNNNTSLACNLNADSANTSDYFSMPSNLDDFDKSVGGVRSAGGVVVYNGEDHNHSPPTGLFLQNSIWSGNSMVGGNSADGVGSGGDTDESFYFKVWNSTKKLNQLGSTITQENAYKFPSYNNNQSKWSEGINGGPTNAHAQQTRQIRLQAAKNPIQISNANNNISINNNNNNNNSSNHFDTILDTSTLTAASAAAAASASTTSCSSSSHTTHTHSASAASSSSYNWQTPILGQTMQPDLKSWSTSNPLSLTEMYGEKDAAANLKGNNTEKRVSGVGGNGTKLTAEMTSTTTTPSRLTVTLPNHSNSSSGFMEYARIKSVLNVMGHPVDSGKGSQSQTGCCPPPAQLMRMHKDFFGGAADDENLLTSERTHFHPIKTYVDGHTFDICNSLDIIDYERSESGYLCLEANKYLEYTRNDSFIADDDVGSATPLYASSNCDAVAKAKASYGGSCQKNGNFIIKFKLLSNDIACQTEDESHLIMASLSQLQQQQQQHQMHLQMQQQTHPFYLNFSPVDGRSMQGGGASCSGLSLQNTTGIHRTACDDAIEALNKAVAIAAKAAAAANLHVDSHWFPTMTSTSTTTSGIYRENKATVGHFKSSSIWTDVQQQASFNDFNVDQREEEDAEDEKNTCDEVDYYVATANAVKQQQQQTWSMNEVVKKCELAGHDHGQLQNMNSMNTAVGMGDGMRDDVHALWSMCAECNNELKSVPANSLLRDELQLEADEIMSDLKYMQDLYIGRGDDEDDDDDVDEVEEDDVCGESSCSEIASESNWADVDDDEDGISIVFDTQYLQGEMDECKEMTTTTRTATTTMDDCCKTTDNDGGEDDDTQAQAVLQKVNRLIANLLRPENAANNTISMIATTEDPLKSATGKLVAETTPPAHQFRGDHNLWNDSYTENNIWKQNGMEGEQNVTTPLRSIDLFRHFNVQPATQKDASAAEFFQTKKDNFLSQLSWEHDNLAKIWQNNTPVCQMSPASLLSSSSSSSSTAASLSSSSSSLSSAQKEKNYGIPLVPISSEGTSSNLTTTAYSAPTVPPISATESHMVTSISFQQEKELRETQDTTTTTGKTDTKKTMSSGDTNKISPSTITTAAAVATYKRVQQFFNSNASTCNAAAAASKLKLANRKRRHSASQHFFHCPSSNVSTTMKCNNSINNNNNVDTADLNRFNLKFISSNPNACTDDAVNDIDMQKFLNVSLYQSAEKNMNKHIDDRHRDNVDCKNILYTNSDDVAMINSEEQQQQQQTIITCNYWTTIEPNTITDPAKADINMMSLVDSSRNHAFACLIDKNASILKHVTMVTRPLTR